MKRLGKLRMIPGGLFLLGTLPWAVLLPSFVAATIRAETGFAVQVDQLSVNPFTANIAIHGLVLKNPAGRPVEQFVELREFRADVNFCSLLGQRFTAGEMVLDVTRVTRVKDPRGTLKVMAFQEALTGKAAAGPVRPAATSPGFLIKRLVLKLDQLVYADHSGPKPSVKEYNLYLSRDLRSVANVAKILSSFSGSALGLVTNTMGGLFKNRPDLRQELASPWQEASKKAGEKLNGLLDSLDMRRP